LIEPVMGPQCGSRLLCGGNPPVRGRYGPMRKVQPRLDGLWPGRSARSWLAYTWTDGTPRVVPVWFHWTGEQFVIGSPARAPKLKALAADPRVALTIDDHTGWPYSVLMVRGNAAVEMLDDVVPEYALSAQQYFGAEQGPAWVSTFRGKPMARIPITPTWVGLLDFQTRFPSALTA
jgi:pyridoxamine 5'-phosphate oxidase-like protein